MLTAHTTPGRTARPDTQPRTPAPSPATEQDRDSLFPPAFHLLVGLFLAAGLILPRLPLDLYGLVLGEDRLIEWWTVTLFIVGGVVRLRAAAPGRRVFDVLVALYCLFVAGEEFSWGQRLFGYNPPSFFLEHNLQQEANLHNLTRTRSILSATLIGYAVVLPLAWRFPRTRRLMEVVGATAPSMQLTPWFLASVLLIQWDPNRLNSEWAECLSAILFLAATWRPGTRRWLAPAATLAAAGVLTVVSAQGRASGTEHLACAQAEVEALLADIATGPAATELLLRTGTPAKRAWSAVNDGHLDLARAPRFAAAGCAGAPSHDAPERRRFAVDPWGTGYYVSLQPASASSPGRVLVFSYGPNRRRDTRNGEPGGDDIVRTAELARK